MSRNAWSADFDDVSLMEWELGSRVTNELLSENSPWGEYTVANRASVGQPKEPERGTLSKYVGKHIMLEDEPFAIYICTSISDSVGEKGIEYIVAEQLDGPDMELKADGGNPLYYFGEDLVDHWGESYIRLEKTGAYTITSLPIRKDTALAVAAS